MQMFNEVLFDSVRCLGAWQKRHPAYVLPEPISNTILQEERLPRTLEVNYGSVNPLSVSVVGGFTFSTVRLAKLNAVFWSVMRSREQQFTAPVRCWYTPISFNMTQFKHHPCHVVFDLLTRTHQVMNGCRIERNMLGAYSANWGSITMSAWRDHVPPATAGNTIDYRGVLISICVVRPALVVSNPLHSCVHAVSTHGSIYSSDGFGLLSI